MLIIKIEQLVFSACRLLFMFYVVTQNLWEDTDRLQKNFVTFAQKLLKSFFCVLKKTQKYVIVCIYYCVTTK